jgi:hypothetical protein
MPGVAEWETFCVHSDVHPQAWNHLPPDSLEVCVWSNGRIDSKPQEKKGEAPT